MNWELVYTELLSLKEHKIKLKDVDDLTTDTLYGSMWGLNIRYVSLKEAFQTHEGALLEYSLSRINKLIETPDFTFKRRLLPKYRLGFGTFGWKYDTKIIKYAIKKASVIDTAEGYGYGKVETELGTYLKESNVEIITKVRRDHMSPFAIKNAVERSVKKLNTIPHVQLHFPNDKFPEAVKDLARLRQKGLVRSIGLSNCSVDMIEQAQRLLSDFSGDVISSVQVPFNVSDRRIKQVILPYCQERGIIIIAYSPLGQNFKKINSPILTKLSKKYDCTNAQIALAYLLFHQGVIPIPITNNLEHLKTNFLSNDLELSKNDILIIEDYYK